MKRKRMLFIYNPLAGKGQVKRFLADIVQVFDLADYDITIHPTEGQGDAREIVRTKPASINLVACSGGDGTLNEVVSGMMLAPKQIPIGYIPAGSTNDFGMSLQLPKGIMKAAHNVVEGRNFPCDCGRFNEDYFIYIAAFGLFTEVSYETSQDLKNLLGHLAYILQGVQKLADIRTYHMKVTCLQNPEDLKEGEEPALLTIEDDFIYGMVTNSISVGGFKKITGKHVVLDDGTFEVTLIRQPHNLPELQNLIAAFVNRDIDTDQIYFVKTAKIIFESNEEVQWTRDGENGGSHRKVTIENLRQAVTMRVPEK